MADGAETIRNELETLSPPCTKTETTYGFVKTPSANFFWRYIMIDGLGETPDHLEITEQLLNMFRQTENDPSPFESFKNLLEKSNLSEKVKSDALSVYFISS